MKKLYIILIIFFILSCQLKANTVIMYSLDGSLSKEYNGQNLDYSGKYYFSFYENNVYEGTKILSINGDKIYIAYSNEDFMYLVKEACDNHLSKTTIIKSGILSDPIKYSSYWLNETLNTYPTLQVEGFSMSYEYSNNNTIITINLDYYIEDNFLFFKYQDDIDRLISNLNYTSFDRDELQYKIYKYILDKCNYESSEFKNTMQGSLIDNKGNCEGYSKSLMFLNNIHGIPTKVVTGITKSGTPHMWNITFCDHIKYHDLTFEDTSFYSFYNLDYSPSEIRNFY